MQLSLGEHVTLRNAEGLRLALLDAFSEQAEVVADASALAEVDLSFVQLMEAARTHAAGLDKRFGLTAAANPAVTALLQRGGFIARFGEADLDFWFHGGRPQ